LSQAQFLAYWSWLRLIPLGGLMSKSRRKFLATTSLGLLGAAVARHGSSQTVSNLPPGEPPAFGTGPAVRPGDSPATFAEAENLARVQLTESERAMAGDSWRRTMASLYERRSGPRKVALESTLAPASHWDPLLPGLKPAAQKDSFVRSRLDPGPLRGRD